MTDTHSSDEQRWLTQLRKGLLEVCTLVVLSQEDGYGYQIVQRLKQVDGLTMNEGTVYPILQRLHREGCLATYRQPSESGPPRKWFQLTQAGRERLLSMIREWGRLHRGVQQLLHEGVDALEEKRDPS
ncbi:MAG: PadR family transcriptional regulator [Planctomycetes bacterium]|nr:PadR family transcriptional regulator [Planctomycetota bacterium]MBL7009344.1 PadR family transcriptional regulator [Planctomycetota bacterium]